MQHRGFKYLKVGDLRVLVKCKTKVQVALEAKKKNTLVDIWKISPADQDAYALLWSTYDETALQSVIKNYIMKDKTALGQERQKILQAYSIAIDNGDLNQESISSIEKAMIKCFIEYNKKENPSEKIYKSV